MKSKMSLKYPDRWLDYSKYGTQVQGTQFVALKVPLGKKFFTESKEDSFTPSDAIDDIPGLGLVIDLTFTTRYYSPAEFVKNNVKHKKIFTKGHEIPKRSLVNQFIRTVNDFLGEEQNKDKLIGVHCTHGLNRTGYFVCAYMILVQGQAPKSAINSFNEARAHTMERANYLNSLMGLIPLSYKAHDDHGAAETSVSRNGYRDNRRRYDRRVDHRRPDPSQENRNGYHRSGPGVHRDRSNNWRDQAVRDDRSNNWREQVVREDRSDNRRDRAVHEDRPNNWREQAVREDRSDNRRDRAVREVRPNNWRKNFFHDDQRLYRNYREYNRWRDSERNEHNRNTPRNDGVEACDSSNGDSQHNRFRWVRKENVE